MTWSHFLAPAPGLDHYVRAAAPFASSPFQCCPRRSGRWRIDDALDLRGERLEGVGMTVSQAVFLSPHSVPIQSRRSGHLDRQQSIDLGRLGMSGIGGKADAAQRKLTGTAHGLEIKMPQHCPKEQYLLGELQFKFIYQCISAVLSPR